MRRIAPFILLLLVVGAVNAQKRKVVTLKQSAPVKEKEVFQVMDDNQQVKDGFYRRYKYRQLIEEGFYKEGKKEDQLTRNGRKE